MTKGDKTMEVDTLDESTCHTPLSEAKTIDVDISDESNCHIPPSKAKTIDVDISDESNCHMPPSKALVSLPVVGGSSGEGLPYAPEDWPCPGDIWRWKVGNRKSVSGYWIDRFLYPPLHLQKMTGSRAKFPSRISVEEYIRKKFPETDVNTFFSSFIWKIPCAGHIPKKDTEKSIIPFLSPRNLDTNEYSVSGSTIRDGDCKAGNKMCSLQVKERSHSLAAKACTICCSEAGFCRDCCCILCCRTIDWAYGGYSFIRCEVTLDEHYICGHVAHIDCALRSYMAGTVGGCIGLDVEYYCRCCGNKTDLISHVTKLIRTCESLDYRDDIVKILNLGLCILRGSEQTGARNLRNRIEFLMSKLKDGVRIGEIWRVEDSISTFNAGDISHLGTDITMLGVPDITRNKSAGDSTNEVESSNGNETNDGRTQRPVYITSDHSNVSVKLEDDVDQVLQELKKSQESEYRIAEQKLYAQKDFLLSLYQQLDVERSELANPTSLPNGSDYDALLTNVLNRVDQIKHEEVKLRCMMKIAKGYGQTPKSILVEHFGIPSDE